MPAASCPSNVLQISPLPHTAISSCVHTLRRRLGANLALAARSHEKLQAVATECRQCGATGAQALAYNASDPAQSEGLIGAAAKLLGGGLDVLVLDHVAPPHSANYCGGTGAAVGVLKDTADVDFYSYVVLAQHALDVFKQQSEVSAYSVRWVHVRVWLWAWVWVFAWSNV